MKLRASARALALPLRCSRAGSRSCSEGQCCKQRVKLLFSLAFRACDRGQGNRCCGHIGASGEHACPEKKLVQIGHVTGRHTRDLQLLPILVLQPVCFSPARFDFKPASSRSQRSSGGVCLNERSVAEGTWLLAGMVPCIAPGDRRVAVVKDIPGTMPASSEQPCHGHFHA